MLAAITTRTTTARWVAFYTVGAVGMGVQLGTLWLLAGPCGVPYLVATALAVEAAILHNFLWHEHWTWSDRTRSVHGSRGAVLGRLARFHAASGLLSILGNVVLTALLVTHLGTGYLVGNVFAVAACSLATFVAADRLVFLNRG